MILFALILRAIESCRIYLQISKGFMKNLNESVTDVDYTKLSTVEQKLT